MTELQKILNDIQAEAEAAKKLSVSENSIDHLKACGDFEKLGRTTVPRLCEALKEAEMVLTIFEEDGSARARICLRRIAAILKGEME